MPRATKSFGYANLQRLVWQTMREQHPGTTQEQAAEAVDHTIAAMAAVLAKGEALRIPDLGTMRPAISKARVGRNPRTGEPAPIPVTGRCNFRPSQAVRDAIAQAKAAATQPHPDTRQESRT